jgi:hypothetical protein
MLAWDWLPACPFLHDLDSEILMVTEHFLLKADRLEAYPTSSRRGRRGEGNGTTRRQPVGCLLILKTDRIQKAES